MSVAQPSRPAGSGAGPAHRTGTGPEAALPRPRAAVGTAVDALPDRAALVDTLAGLAATPGARGLLVGEPGIGKTSVLEAALQRAREAGVTVLHARASEPRASQPFHVLIDLLAGWDEGRLARLPAVQREAVDVALARRPVQRPLPPSALRVAVTALLADLVREQPVCVAVDDWPWLDRETAAVLHHALQRAAPGRPEVALLATQRLDGVLTGTTDEIDRTVFPPAAVLPVPPLDVASLAGLLTSRYGEEPTGEEIAQIHRATGGNPLWAGELADARRGRPWAVPDQPGLPASIAGVLGARVRALSAGALDVLALAAAMGGGPTPLLVELSATGGQGLVDAFDAEVVREVDGWLQPVHPLLGAAALQAVGASGRMRLHARIAGVATSASELAYHLDLAVPPGTDERVAAALSRASSESRAQGATASALLQADRALERTRPGSPAHDRRVVAQAEVAFAAGEFGVVPPRLKALDPLDLPLDLFDRALAVLVDAATLERGEQETLTMLRQVRERVAADPVRRAAVGAYIAETRWLTVDERRAQAESTIAALTEQRAAPIALHRALGALLTARLDAGEGLDAGLLARKRLLEQSLNLVTVVDSAEAQVGTHAFQVDDLDASRTALHRLVGQTMSSGEEVMGGFFTMHLVVVELLAGDVASAAGLLAGIEDIAPWRSTFPPSVVRTRGLLAIAQGRRDVVDAVVHSPAGPGSEIAGRIARLAVAGIAEARDENWAAAVPLLTQARELSESKGVRDPSRRLWLDAELAEGLIALGDVAAARPVVDRLGALAPVGARPLASGQELRLRGLMAAGSGDLAAAEELLEASAGVLAGGGFRIEQARSLLELGRVLRRRRAKGRARDTVQQALTLAEATGDVPLLRRVRREVPGHAGRRTDGVLTGAEEKVAAAVAGGASNREIAAALFISVRTVEAHLSSIYRKMQVRSRAQLAARLHVPPAD